MSQGAQGRHPQAPDQKRPQERGSPVQRKYSSIYMSRTTPTSTAKKSIPPAVQLARAIKCLDVFGKHDPDAASFYAQRSMTMQTWPASSRPCLPPTPLAGGSPHP